MRYGRIIALMAFGFLLAARPAAAWVDTFVPGDGCGTLGAAHMSADHTALVACTLDYQGVANDCASGGGCTWKTMSNSGGGGGSYTAYGQTTCASGWTVAYIGHSTTGVIDGHADLTNVFCANPAGISGSEATYNNLLWYRNSILSRNMLPCAVCVK